ncbi:MAG: hypothetical protein RMH84_07220 [Sulfolobales archaeon]|nr:hypothetical protein [Sulfolobales archaeon]
MEKLNLHGKLKKHRVDWYEYWSWKCNYCPKILVGSYEELVINVKRHLKKHSIEVEES